VAFKVEWTEPALKQLGEVLHVIRSENPLAADRFSSQLLHRVEQLARFPRSAEVYRRRRGYEVRQFSYGKYRVFYQVRPRLQRVEILAIRHGARREPRLPGGRF